MRVLAVLLALAAAGLANDLESRLFVVRVTTERPGPTGPVRQTLAAPALPVGPDGLLIAVGFALQPPADEAGEAIRVTAIDPAGEERPARILRGAEDLDCTFFRVEGSAPEPVALQGAPVRPGDEVVLLGRHGERMGWALRRGRARVDAVVERPRRLAALLDTLPQWTGAMAATTDGKLIGFVDMQPTFTDGDGMMLGVGSQTLVVVAAETYAEAAAYSGEVKARAWLGVNLAPFNADREAFFGVEGDWRGALVTGVSPGSPAAKAGLRVFDLLQSIGPLTVRYEAQSEWDEMLRAVQRLPLGKPLPCKVVRFADLGQGRYRPETLDLTLTLEERPLDFDDAPETEIEDLGLKVKPLTLDWRRMAQVPDGAQGVVVSATARASPVRLAGLLPGDLVMRVDDQPVPDIAGFTGHIDAAREAKRPKIVLFIRRGAETLFVAVETNW